MSSIDNDAETQPSPKKMRPSPMKSAGTAGSAKPKPKGTLYITVGPQCAGKTTMLKHIFGQSFHKNEESMTSEEAIFAGIDVTIDDQALVYVPVPTSYFLSNATDASSHNAGASPSLNETILGKTIRERILDQSNEELVLVTKRLGGAIGAEDFALRLKGSTNISAVSGKTPQDDLIDAVEHVIQTRAASEGETNHLLPETIGLFIVESIFRPRPLDLLQKLSSEQTVHPNTSALDQALHLLNTTATDSRAHSPTAPLSWGNTNTRPREFKSALEAAAKSGRPVEFIVFGGVEACEMIREHMSRREFRKSHNNDATAAADTDILASAGSRVDSELEQFLCLPKLDRQTLFQRNLLRFCNTGRYIPSNAISDAMVRVESLLASAAAEANKDYPEEERREETSLSTAKFRLDSELAKMAGYRMNADRTVTLLQSSTVYSSNGGRNSGHQRNNFQPRRGEYHNPRQQGGYYGGRGRGYGGGRGGRSNYHSGGRYQNDRRSYSNPGRGRGYGQDQPESGWSSGRYGTEYRGRENKYGRGGRSFDQNSSYGWGSGRGRGRN